MGLVALSGLRPLFPRQLCTGGGSKADLPGWNGLEKDNSCDPTNPVPACLGILGKRAVTEHLLSGHWQCD